MNSLSQDNQSLAQELNSESSEHDAKCYQIVPKVICSLISSLPVRISRHAAIKGQRI
jgi:hypothetical protein